MGTVASVMGSNAGPAIASAQAGQTVAQRGNYELTAVEAVDDTLVIRLVKLPAQHRIVSLVVEVADLDQGAAGLLDIGVLDIVQDPADTTDLTLVVSGLSMQAASVTRYETQAMLEFPVTNYDRFILVGIATAAATGDVGGIAATLVTRPELGSQFEN
jgi:hypothetical protein